MAEHRSVEETAIAEGQTAAAEDGIIIAEGVDEEPIEANRRTFEGLNYRIVATVAALYAAFHMAALNGVSIGDWTGIEVPFLPTFPMETWNFRIVHIAGTLALGFLLFAGRSFADDEADQTRVTRWLSYLLLIPALFSFGAALSFARDIAGGTSWNGLDAGLRFKEIWLFGVPAHGGDGGRHDRLMAAQARPRRLCGP